LFFAAASCSLLMFEPENHARMLLWILHDILGNWLASVGLYRLFGVLDQLQFRALAAAGLAFAIVIVFGKRTIAWLARQKIGDAGMSDAEALKRVAGSKANTPTMGGVLIVGAIALSVLLLADLGNSYVRLALVVMIWLTLVGGADDWLKLTSARRGIKSRQGLYAWEKLVFQLGLGLLVGWFTFNYGIGAESPAAPHALNVPFQKTYVLSTEPALPALVPPDSAPTTTQTPKAPTAPAVTEGAEAAAVQAAESQPRVARTVLNDGVVILGRALFVVIAMLMVAGLSNAANITDGMDGLAAGVSSIIALGLFVLTMVAGIFENARFLLVPYVPGAAELSVVAGAMGGACLGFLWWNCSPAAVFMGDTGSLSLGGLVGYIAVVTRQEIIVLVMCGVFLLEIASVILQVGFFKATGGKRIFRCAPYHHHLHLLGWTEQQIVARAWIVSVLLVLLALASIKVR
jgi:phospho-N-acetylmuramoyl-pentapeptide-transferase